MEWTPSNEDSTVLADKPRRLTDQEITDITDCILVPEVARKEIIEYTVTKLQTVEICSSVIPILTQSVIESCNTYWILNPPLGLSTVEAAKSMKFDL